LETTHTSTPKPLPYEDGLESQRLRTRFLTLDDIERWHDFFTDPLVLELFPASMLGPEDGRAKTWIERQLGRYHSGAFGHQALIHKKTGEFIGMCGLILQEVDGKPEVEVGYHILKQYRGKGYAPEAARLFIDYAFKNNITSSVISIISIANLNSQRVAVKNGLKVSRKTTWRDMEVFIYQVNKNKRDYL
jgi:ribosomal-protein-alanine N-acetyltransferase